MKINEQNINEMTIINLAVTLFWLFPAAWLMAFGDLIKMIVLKVFKRQGNW